MKKSLLALALIGAFTGAASAQTNVTIYGVADVGITHTRSNTPNSATWGMGSGIQSGSRLGFKGTEDLGGGLSAIFQLENGFGVDTGALGQGGRIFGRQAFVGLNGGFGSVKFGRQYMPIFLAVDTIDPFGTGLAGDASGWLGANIFGGIDVRMNNTINYSIASGGLSGEIAYGFGEVAGNNSASRQVGLSVGYTGGPVTVVLAHHDANDAAGTGSTKATLLGGTYDFGAAKLHAGLDNEKNDAAGATTLDARTWMLGVSAPVGAAGSVLASYNRRDDKTAANADANQVALGYTHSLSKRTNLYTSFARVNVNGVRNFNVGIRHKF